MRSRRPLSTSNDAMATAASCCVSSAARVLGVTARFFEGVFFTELGDAVAVTRCRDDARVSGLVLLGPMGSDREQALAEISGFYLFTFHIFKRSLAPVTAAININIFHVHILFRTQRARASCLGSTRPVCQTARNRLKIGARREGTVPGDILETRRLPRTDG